MLYTPQKGGSAYLLLVPIAHFSISLTLDCLLDESWVLCDPRAREAEKTSSLVSTEEAGLTKEGCAKDTGKSGTWTEFPGNVL